MLKSISSGNKILLLCGLSFWIAYAGQRAASSTVSTTSASKSTAANPANPVATNGGSTLNQRDIHSVYNEGDFDKVITLIENFTKSNKTYSRADSIFISKHLAVVYSANPKTREKGKYYMYRLLEMLPSAELVDMFVSDEIDRIFDKVRKEFLARQKGFGVDSSQISMPDKPAPGTSSMAAASSGSQAASPLAGQSSAAASPGASASATQGQTFWKRNGFWIAGGAGLAIAGVAAVYIASQQSDSPAGKSIVISNQSSATSK